MPQYDASLGTPLAEDLSGRGWTALNVEYRRVGNGGGFPATFDDVAAAIDALADTDASTTSTVVTLGHSAGGHLATWAAARTRFDEWSGGIEVTHVISQAGVLDLTAAQEQGLGGGAVDALMGAGPSDPSYDLADPSGTFRWTCRCGRCTPPTTTSSPSASPRTMSRRRLPPAPTPRSSRSPAATSG